MIRVRYSNDHVAEYSSLALAKFMVMSVLFASRGEVLPVEATEVWGFTTNGVTVEKDLKIRMGVVEFE
jgi:hypothetical protein